MSRYLQHIEQFKPNLKILQVKKPKGFNKMTLEQQEDWLVKERQELNRLLTTNSRNLSTVRGGQKIEIKAEERPDEVVLKEK
jgi:hypothetical protein